MVSAQSVVAPSATGSRTVKGFIATMPKAPVLIIACVIAAALLADVLPLPSPYAISLGNKLKPPFWLEGGSLSYPLGTDSVGRDVLGRIVYGARASLLVSALALFVGATLGTAVGMVAGYYGGRLETILMRAVDATIAFPIILFALLLAVTLGPSLMNVVLAIGLVIWARYARLIWAEVLSLRESAFVLQAKIIGASGPWIIRYHLLPNVFASLLVMISLQMGWVIIVEATLSFLGAGVPPPDPSWGSMVADGRRYIMTAWWISLFPGVAMLLVVLAFNLFGDWLRDVLDPKMKQV